LRNANSTLLNNKSRILSYFKFIKMFYILDTLKYRIKIIIDIGYRYKYVKYI